MTDRRPIFTFEGIVTETVHWRITVETASAAEATELARPHWHDKPCNDDRAGRIAHALAAYRANPSGGLTSPDEDVIDLLTDLRHYCDRHDLNLGNCDRIAHENYLEELHEGKAGGQ